MQVETCAHNNQASPTTHRGFQGCGRGRGGGAGRGQGQIICYNYGELGHFACDCHNPTHHSCQLCKQFDYVIEECPILIENMQEKKNQQPTQNIQMMSSGLRKDNPSVNIVTQSGIATS